MEQLNKSQQSRANGTKFNDATATAPNNGTASEARSKCRSSSSSSSTVYPNTDVFPIPFVPVDELALSGGKSCPKQSTSATNQNKSFLSMSTIRSGISVTNSRSSTNTNTVGESKDTRKSLEKLKEGQTIGKGSKSTNSKTKLNTGANEPGLKANKSHLDFVQTTTVENSEELLRLKSISQRLHNTLKACSSNSGGSKSNSSKKNEQILRSLSKSEKSFKSNGTLSPPSQAPAKQKSATSRAKSSQTCAVSTEPSSEEVEIVFSVSTECQRENSIQSVPLLNDVNKLAPVGQCKSNRLLHDKPVINCSPVKQSIPKETVSQDKVQPKMNRTNPLAKGGYQSGRKGIRNRRKDKYANAECLKAGPGILARAQTAEMTLTGLTVLKGEVSRIITAKEQDKIRSNPSTPNKIRMLLEPPFNVMSPITDHLGLTGLGGLILEGFEQFKRPVKCVMNVTYESPIFKVPGIDTYRIPVADDKKEDISIYFDEVGEKINEIKNNDAVTIVHCMAGVSRSATIVMAYLIRFLKMTVKEAFKHTKTARPIINPNLAFLEQLVGYEWKCHGTKSTRMIEHTIDEVTKQLPDFIIDEYLDDYKHEFEPEFQ